MNCRNARESASLVPEAAQGVRTECAQTSTAQTAEKAIFVPVVQIDQVLPGNESGLGGSGIAGKKIKF